MIWRIDTFAKQKQSCADIVSQIEDLGNNAKVNVYSRKVYFIEADFDHKQAERVASELLTDPLIEDYFLTQGLFNVCPPDNQILITYNPGVYDSIIDSLRKAVEILSLEFNNAITARFYEFQGLAQQDIFYLAPKILYNPLIEHLLNYQKVKNVDTLDEFKGKDYQFNRVIVSLIDSSAEELEEISKKGCLALSPEEMKVVQDYFKKEGRNPTDCELETIATLWSEHCSHQTFRGIIEYQEQSENGSIIKEERINNLLKTTVVKATEEINSPSCVSVFDDNSGVVKFDESNNICFKVETHNHPSSLEPYGGASTGIGGVIRDILGTGCAAKPFASIDVFCFSPWNMKIEDLPEGLLHPKRIIKGVIKGVRDYGNRMGIPTVSGAVLFDERFLGNPLVYCGTLGILPKEKSFKEVKPGDLVILCGAKTGRDGIHGATFSSQELDEQTVGLTSAVQIGNPIEEKKLVEAILRARDDDLFRAITDCGAGGISSAITELSGEYGVEVDLNKVPLKYRGLTYTEIWISESQERMVFFAPVENLDKLKSIFSEEDVDLSVVGKVTDSKKLVLFYGQDKVCDLDMDFIFQLPKLVKKAIWVKNKETDRKLKDKDNYNQELKNLLSRPGIACKDWVVREYDHEVQSGSVLKSISGIEKIIVNDASVVRPDLKSDKCVAIGLGINPFYSDIDPYWMAASAINEALRNIIAVGGSLKNTFILDNFSWGSPLDKKTLGGLVRAAWACRDFSTYFQVPFISGKDSLYNEYLVGEKHIAIPGTLLISAVSVIPDWQITISSNFKEAESLVYVVGQTYPEMGASEYFRCLDIKEGIVPRVDKKTAKIIFDNLSEAINKKIVMSCHDLSEGGIGVCLAEMCIGGDLGVNVFLEEIPHDNSMFCYEVLFSESSSRFVVEVAKKHKDAFEKQMKDVPFGLIGCTCKHRKLGVYDKHSREIINLKVEELKESWLKTFKEFRCNLS